MAATFPRQTLCDNAKRSVVLNQAKRKRRGSGALTESVQHVARMSAASPVAVITFIVERNRGLATNSLTGNAGPGTYILLRSNSSLPPRL